MPPNIDSYIWIFDLEGFGYSDFYLDSMKRIISAIQKVFVNTVIKIACANPNWATKVVWNTLKPFLNERVIQKIVFLDNFSEEQLANGGIHMFKMPVEWGGSSENPSIAQG